MLKGFFNKRYFIVFLLFLILISGLYLRHLHTKNYNIVFDFDQYEDLYYTYKLAVDHKFPIIGRAIYGDARIHHGVFYYYYNALPFIASNGNPMAGLYWNILFNASVSLILFFLSFSIFKKIIPALLASVISAFSFELIKFSNWLTIDTPAVFLTPLFYLGLWIYKEGKKWGLPLTAATLGLSIQTDLSLIYLSGIFILYWLIFRPKLPGLKLFLLSSAIFLISLSTLILTEIKLNFSGVKTMLSFSSNFSDTALPYTQRITLFWQDMAKNFANSLQPQRPDLGETLLVVIILIALISLWAAKKKQEKSGIIFCLLYLFSPAVTLFLGYHQKPWFLIAVPPAAALMSGYALSKLRYMYLILPLILIVVMGNTKHILEKPLKSYQLFDSIYDSTSDLNYQLEVVKYTYNDAGGPFSFNAVTYPLYYNGMWAYLYNWYGRKNYGFTPSWMGGDQLYPYNLLPKAKNTDKFFYLLISETGRIPEIYKNKGIRWAEENGRLIEEKTIGGFKVLKYKQSL